MNGLEPTDTFPDVVEAGLPEFGESEPEPELTDDDLKMLDQPSVMRSAYLPALQDRRRS